MTYMTAVFPSVAEVGVDMVLTLGVGRVRKGEDGWWCDVKKIGKDKAGRCGVVLSFQLLARMRRADLYFFDRVGSDWR